ncbi:zinc finger, C3HC4 type [Ancylostoma caninum]|uniref:Zinc finger, C3HC4 type n=1 Tax=Ancylostoma caninum TaxID=29170 RepID=A0A368G996_ANCCA|nr:zinc finger, C3HC4 type [Ancylostoma caninum]
MIMPKAVMKSDEYGAFPREQLSGYHVRAVLLRGRRFNCPWQTSDRTILLRFQSCATYSIQAVVVKVPQCLLMSQVRGRCVICTSTFISNNIAALQCGHTFHFDCVSKWVERSKTCPNCRVRTTDRQIIKHLYFDAPDEFNTTQVISSDVQVETLSIALEKEKNDHLEVLEEVRKLKDQVSSLQAKLDRERTRFREKVPSLEARNRQLEMMLINQQELEKALEKTKCRLRACEFYKAVTAGKDENAMDKYVKDDGSVEVGQFLNILRRLVYSAVEKIVCPEIQVVVKFGVGSRSFNNETGSNLIFHVKKAPIRGHFDDLPFRQLEEARKVQVSLTNELRAERELLRTSKKKEADLKNFVKALERELRDVRSAANMGSSTPFNPKLRGLALDQSPSKRNSLGFNDSVELNVDVISSALKQRCNYVRLTFIPPLENPGPSGITQPLFSDLLDDEDAANASTADVSLQYPSSLDKIRSPRVPKTLRERVVAGSSKARSSSLANAHRAAEKALENLELRSVSSTSISMRKPLAKRKIENSSLNPGLSHFFIKRSKSTEVIDLEE